MMKFFKNHFPFCFVSSKNHFGGCTHTFTFSTSFPELAAQLTYMITREKYLSRFFLQALYRQCLLLDIKVLRGRNITLGTYSDWG